MFVSLLSGINKHLTYFKKKKTGTGAIEDKIDG